MYTTQNEQARVAALEALNILDTPDEKAFDNITSLAAEICNVPIALVSLLDDSRQWFKSKVGIASTETPKSISFCQYAITQDDIYEVQNTLKSARFKDNPLVTGEPSIRFYAGAPLITPEGHKLGTLCVIDRKPRRLNKQQRNALIMLAEQTVQLILARAQNNTNRELTRALQEQVHLLDKLTNDIPEMIAYWDKNLICRFANKNYCDPIRKNVTEVIGQHYDDVLPAGLLNNVKPYLLRALKGETCEHDISDSVYSSLTTIKYARYLPDLDANGEVQGVLTSTSDVTHQRKSEDSIALFAKVISQSSDCVLITDKDFYTEYVNAMFTQLTQYDKDDVIGQSPSFLFSESDQHFGFSDIQKHVLENGFWKSDCWHTKKDGSRFYTLISIDVIRDEGGNPLHYIFSMRDQTEKEQILDELLLMTDMLNRTGKMAKVGGWELNLASKAIKWTDEVFRIHDLPPPSPPELAEAINFYPAEAKSVLEHAINNCVKTGKPWDLELPFVSAKNKHRWVRATGECIFFNQSPLKLVGTFQDITDRKVAETHKQQDAIKQRNTLVREVHHRIKNNLQGVSGILSNFALKHPNHAEPFNEANGQLQSVAIIYGLQGASDNAKIELSKLISAIKSNNERIWQTSIKLLVSDDWQDAYIAKNEAVPIALILNELVTNAAKHQTTKHSIEIHLNHVFSRNQNEVDIKDRAVVSIRNIGQYASQSDNSPLEVNASGLGLVNSLMPKIGAILKWNTASNHVHVQLTLSYPTVNF